MIKTIIAILEGIEPEKPVNEIKVINGRWSFNGNEVNELNPWQKSSLEKLIISHEIEPGEQQTKTKRVYHRMMK